MSSTQPEEVICACGEAFETEVYQSVSVGQDPELKEQILGGQFNVVKCPRCQQMLYVERFVLYHDSKLELLAFVYPKAMEPQIEEIRVAMGGAFAKLQEELAAGEKMRYQPFLLFGMDALCDLLNIEEEIEDETKVVQALCGELKLAFRRIHFEVARRNNIPPLLPFVSQAAGKSKNVPTQEEVMEGLNRVLERNPYLVHYKILQGKAASEWVLKDSDFI